MAKLFDHGWRAVCAALFLLCLGTGWAAPEPAPKQAPEAAPKAAPTAAPTACAVVFGQGRNAPEASGPDWDALNERFNSRVAASLEARGRRVFPVLASVTAIDPADTSERLLRMAERLRCATLIETALFVDTPADGDTATVVARLRVYPISPTFDAQSGALGLRIGTPLFTTQHELNLSDGVFERLPPDLLGDLMAEAYLQRFPK